jgi:ribosomal protein S18 acetylase RimI-like enzyme
MMSAERVTIRRASEADLHAVVKLSCALFQEDAGQRDPSMNLDWPKEEGETYYAGLIAGHGSVCIVAELSGNVVGYLTGYVRKMTRLRPMRLAELESMFVQNEFRGRDVGRQLVNSFLDWCREKGAQRVGVSAYVANDGAVAFYIALGFEPQRLTLELGLE